MKPQIVCFHLLNDKSGSPFILSLTLQALLEKGFEIVVYSSKGNGFLSNITGIDFRPLLYKWSSSKMFLVLLFILTQFQLFFIVLIKFSHRKNQIFYINTILPFGAALAGHILKKEIVYHIHEHYIRPNIIQIFSLWVMSKVASKVIVVSDYLKLQTVVDKPVTVVHNVLSEEFCKISQNFLKAGARDKRISKGNVLMVSSLKIYKGIIIFIDIAKRMPEYEFNLVVNASDCEVNDFTNQHSIPVNLNLYSVKSNLHPFYQKAGILVNLTVPDLCIETFGMTILEGMSYGLPIIAPPVGGPVELVKDGVNGYLIDSRDNEYIIIAIKKILDQEELYTSFSKASIQIAQRFKYPNFANEIMEVMYFKNV